MIGYGAAAQNPSHQRPRLGGRAARNAEPIATVQNVVPIRAGFEYLTLRCTSCGLVYDAQAEYSGSKARGWINSELVPPM